MTTVILVGAPRSGAGLIAQVLSGAPGWSGSALSEVSRLDLTAERIAASGASGGDQSTAVGWSPRLSARADLVAQALPDARFVWVVRRPLLAISSLMEAWRSGRFVTEPDLEGWWGEQWSFPLIDSWRDLIGAPPAAVAATQWDALTTSVIDVLSGLDRARWTVASFESFIVDPGGEIDRVCGELGISWDGITPDPLPTTSSAVTEPGSDVWRRNASEILTVLPEHEATVQRVLETARSRRPGFTFGDLPDDESPEAGRMTMASEGTPFSSSHTASVVELLRQSRLSLAISTYKSGHVIVARADGQRLNTEFTSLSRPMGIAVAGPRLSIGTADAIVTATSMPGLAERLLGDERVDVAYVPRSVTFTGDVAIHDMAFDADGVLHFVNTKFSCLCRQDLDYSFVPTWRPPWITAYAAEDRCHLNGLAMVNGRPRYATALAMTDTENGWREHKGTSGVVIDVTTDDVVAGGLSMPHSPRWYDGCLWVLESGRGTLSTVDLATGQRTVVATLPGFTRGLSFIGPYAFVGLSQVRETVFSTLPITQRAAERNCGVWVIDIRSGEVAGFIKFDGMVQEIFEVQVLPAAWPVLLDASPLTQSGYVLPDDVLEQIRTES